MKRWWKKYWSEENINKIHKAQPWIIGMNLVISGLTLYKIFVYPHEVFTCALNTYNPSQIICIKE
jgi:hypothetical protein